MVELIAVAVIGLLASLAAAISGPVVSGAATLVMLVLAASWIARGFVQRAGALLGGAGLSMATASRRPVVQGLFDSAYQVAVPSYVASAAGAVLLGAGVLLAARGSRGARAE